MQTLHLRASGYAIEQLMDSINRLAKEGNEIEILDDFIFEKEKKMVSIALDQIEKGEVYSHEEVWQELLSE